MAEPPPIDPAEEERRTTELLRKLELGRERSCSDCSRDICGHELVISVALGFQDTPRCAPCVATALGRDPHEFLDHVHDYIDHRECFRTGWAWAGDDEGMTGARPACLWGGGAHDSDGLRFDPAAPTSDDENPDRVPDAEWDAGDMSCGDLVLQLRIRLNALQPRSLFALTATDPAAPQDIPAWCGLTGHALIEADHPRYWIRRKD